MYFRYHKKDENLSLHGRFKTILLLSLVIPWMHLSSCKRSNGPSQNEEGPIEITYWCDSNPISVNLAAILVENWNSTHDDIKVKLVPIPASHSSEETILAAIAGGTTPDLSENIWAGGVPTYSSAGGMVKLDDFPDFTDYVEQRLPEGMLENVTGVDGFHYAIPYRTNPIMVLYNTEIFKNAGIKAPLRTYSQFFQAAQAITADTDNDGHIDQWMGYTSQQPIWWHRMFDFYCFFIAASGGNRLLDGDKICFDNEAAIETMAFFQGMFEKGYYPRTEFPTDPFNAGKVATIITGPWHLTYLEKYKTENLQYDLMPLPVPDQITGPTHTYTSTHCLGIFSTTKHPKAVWEFIKYLTSPENDLELMKTSHQLPVRKNLLTNPGCQSYFEANPLMAKFASQLPYCPPMDTNENFKEVLDAISQEFEMCAVYNRKSPQEAIGDAVKRTQVILEWNRSR